MTESNVKGLTTARLLAGLCVLVGGPVVAEDLLWSEEFNEGATPDTSIWSYDLGDWGWGNQELQNYTNSVSNVRVEDGNLVINVRNVGTEEAPSFTSGRIRTENKLTFKYATVEARIKFPDLREGLWPAFWTLGDNFGEVGWPHCGEIDIVEMGSRAAEVSGVTNRRVGSTIHWEQRDTHVYYGTHIDAEYDLNDDYAIFRMEWTPDTVTTFLDGRQIYIVDITEPSCNDCSEFHEPHFMILNVAVGGTFTQRFHENDITATVPAEMMVDWIRVYDNGDTVMGGTGFDETEEPEEPEEPLPLPPNAERSGSWFNETQSGHGFSMEFGRQTDGTPLAVIYWYTYDSDGNPIFMLGTGVPEQDRVEVTFQSPTGMVYGEFDPDSVSRDTGGTGVFEFSDNDNATFSYTPSPFSNINWGHRQAIENLPLIKLFGVPLTVESGLD